MKKILISIQPKWVEKILNGEKSVEIRKTFPKCELPIDVYIYCTKGQPNEYLTRVPHYPKKLIPEYFKQDLPEFIYSDDNYVGPWGNNILNGKVVAKFTLNKIDRFSVPYPAYFYEVKDKYAELMKKSNLDLHQLHLYLRDRNGYAWHINNLEIFDKPMNLSDFGLIKAPQSWQYIEGVE